MINIAMNLLVILAIGICKLLLSLEFGLLSVKDLNTGFGRRRTSTNIVAKLLMSHKYFVIYGSSGSMLNQMP